MNGRSNPTLGSANPAPSPTFEEVLVSPAKEDLGIKIQLVPLNTIKLSRTGVSFSKGLLNNRNFTPKIPALKAVKVIHQRKSLLLKKLELPLVVKL